MDMLTEAVELAQQRQPFVLATVVWRRGPTSGRSGSKAIIHADGTMNGWLGGACAEPSLRKHAQQALSTGEPMVLALGDMIGDAPNVMRSDTADVRHIAMACESDGALAVYLEPYLPAPQVVVVGRSPATDAIAEIALSVGWTALVIDDGGDAGTHTRPELVRTKLDFDSFGGTGLGPVDAATAVVVATQGHYDDLALEAALRTSAGYVGLVASRRRADAVLAMLAAAGVGPDALACVHAPAGLDLGSMDNAEIAVSVMADLVQRRAAGELVVPVGMMAGMLPRREAIDPVCAMTVFVDDAKYHAVVEGVDYWFCAAGCRKAFVAAPHDYLRA